MSLSASNVIAAAATTVVHVIAAVAVGNAAVVHQHPGGRSSVSAEAIVAVRNSAQTLVANAVMLTEVRTLLVVVSEVSVRKGLTGGRRLSGQTPIDAVLPLLREVRRHEAMLLHLREAARHVVVPALGCEMGAANGGTPVRIAVAQMETVIVAKAARIDMEPLTGAMHTTRTGAVARHHRRKRVPGQRRPQPEIVAIADVAAAAAESSPLLLTRGSLQGPAA